jgi:hypothetical protein
VGSQKTDYVVELAEVKGILKNMAEIEKRLSFLEDENASMWWELGPISIYIDDVESDTYYLTVAVSPKIKKWRRYVRSSIYYYYKIKGRHIEREMLPTQDLPAFRDKGKKVLKELVSILNSGDLVLKKNKNAP